MVKIFFKILSSVIIDGLMVSLWGVVDDLELTSVQERELLKITDN